MLGAALAGARELLAAAGRALGRLAPLRALGRAAVAAPARIFDASLRRPGRVLALALVLAAVGWVADTQTRVVSDVQRLVPGDLPALRDLHTLQDATDSSGEIDVLIRGDDLARPQVVALDAELPRARAAPLRLRRGEGLSQRDAVPGVLAARPLPGHERQARERDRRAARAPCRRTSPPP